VQSGERQLHLGLDPHGASQREIGRRLDRVLKQRGLSDPCRAPHHQHPTAPNARAIDQLIKDLALCAAPKQIHHASDAERPPAVGSTGS
jgi:hypothetical protein